MPESQPHSNRPVATRKVITVAELAARLERRLYSPDITESAVHDGCVAARRQGIAAVITRPEHLEVAAAALAGSDVGLVTALSWHGRDEMPLQVDDVVAEAEALARRGADHLAYVVTAARLEPDGGQQVAQHVRRLVDAVGPTGVKVRAIVGTEGLTEVQIRRTCQDLAAAGVWMVQGGSWRARRTGLSHVETIRAALPPEVLVKWTEPVKAVSTMLLCLSLGVDRFNCDVDQVLGDARRAEWLSPLTIPVAGVDY
jgi:deoxyribose-phosphate aldolase